MKRNRTGRRPPSRTREAKSRPQAPVNERAPGLRGRGWRIMESSSIAQTAVCDGRRSNGVTMERFQKRIKAIVREPGEVCAITASLFTHDG